MTTDDNISDRPLRPRRPSARAAVPRIRHVAKRFATSHAIGWLFVALLFLGWQLVATRFPSPNLPPLSALGVAAWNSVESGGLGQALGATVLRMAAGYGLAVVFGVSVGVLIGNSGFARALLEPLIELVRPIPVAAIIPLLILFFGIGLAMKVWVVFVGASFPIILNTQMGVLGVPLTLRQTAETFRLTPLQTLREITLPYAVPPIFVGFRLALATALIISVISEMIAGDSGIGYFILQSQQTLAVKDMYVGIAALGLTGYLLNLAFVKIEQHALRWRPQKAG
jgi:NitT/TauT family transport system permease protein